MTRRKIPLIGKLKTLSPQRSLNVCAGTGIQPKIDVLDAAKPESRSCPHCLTLNSMREVVDQLDCNVSRWQTIKRHGKAFPK